MQEHVEKYTLKGMDIIMRAKEELAGSVAFTADENRAWLEAKRRRQADYLARYGRPVLNDVLRDDEPRFDFDIAPRAVYRHRAPVSFED